MFRAVVLTFAVALPTAAPAGDYVADAFGIVPVEEMEGARATWSGLRTSAGAATMAEPGGVSAVLIFAGPKSLVAGKDEGHAVALALDPHGNPVADGLAATFVIGAGDRQVARTRGGIADITFDPQPTSGIVAVGAALGQVQSPRALVRVTADLESVRPAIVAPGSAVVAETLGTFSTTPLSDQFGNAVEDGIAATWVLRHEDGLWSQQVGVALDGVVGIDFMARDVTTDAQAVVSIAAAGSEAATLEISPVEAAFEPDIRLWRAEDLQAVWMRAGPFTTDAGFLLTDGAEVQVIVQGASGAVETQAGWVRDGYFETLLPLASGDGPYDVSVRTVLGTEVRQVFPGEAPQGIRGVE